MHLLAWLRPWQVRLPQRRPRDGERVDRVRLPTHPAGTTFRHRQLRRDPHQLLTQAEQLPLKPRRQSLQSSTAHSRSASSADAQPISSSLPTATVRSSSIRPASSTATAVTDCLCTSTPITIIKLASKAVGGDRRTDRPQSRRKPRSYQVTLDGLGRRRRHNTRKSDQSRDDIRNRVSRRRSSLRHPSDATADRE